IDGGHNLSGVLVSGTNGIIVAAGSTDVVTLRNLDIDGLGSGLDGIKFMSGKVLNIQNVVVYGFINGIEAQMTTAANMNIDSSFITTNSNDGVRATTTMPAISVAISNSLIQSSAVSGVEVSDGAVVSIRDSDLSLNTIGLNITGNGQGNADNV